MRSGLLQTVQRGGRRRCLALVAAVAMVASLLLAAAGASPAVAAPGTWLSRINAYRASNGLRPLAEDPVTGAVAQGWTQRMASTGVLAHNPLLTAQVTTPWSRIGENVGEGQSEDSLFRAFVASSSHRAHLLGNFNAVGIGQVVSGGRLWTTHVFLLTDAVLQPAPPAVTTVGAAGRRDGGLWTTTSTGKVTARAGAPHLGQLNAAPDRPVVGMASTPSGRGYWLVGSDGGIFAFGDAPFHGSAGASGLKMPIVGMASTPSGDGYWLVGSDGGIFAFGDAPFSGSTGAFTLREPIVGMAATPSGGGYWLVGGDGGIFAFGDAPFSGSVGAVRLVSPVRGITRSATGRGYRMVAADGGIFSFGDAAFYGSLGGAAVPAPVVGMATTGTGHGYWLVRTDNGVTSFGDAPAA